MPSDLRLICDRFPRASQYDPEWVISTGMGSPALWLAEWLASSLWLRPGMRVLDLGCGRAATSIFLAREFGVQVWAGDLWISASENAQRIRDAGVEDRVFPLHVDARALPFAGEFFDGIVCIDAFSYFGTDDLYLNYLANFVKADGQLAFAGAGLMHEFDGAIPDHLKGFWTEDFWCLHSADWWRRHWQRTGIVDLELADSMADGWRAWLDWQQTAHPENQGEIAVIEADQGRCLGYIRMIARRRRDAKLQDYCWPDNLKSFPAQYEKRTLLRDRRQ